MTDPDEAIIREVIAKAIRMRLKMRFGRMRSPCGDAPWRRFIAREVRLALIECQTLTGLRLRLVARHQEGKAS